MPEPNLPPLVVYEDQGSVPAGLLGMEGVVVLEALREGLPELPSVKRGRLVHSYGLLPEHSFTLVVSLGPRRRTLCLLVVTTLILDYLKSLYLDTPN